MAPKSKAEKKYLAFAASHGNSVYSALPGANREGFEYFESEEYRKANPESETGVKGLLFSGGAKQFFAMVRIFGKYMASIMGNRKKCFTELDPYLSEIEEKGTLKATGALSEDFPNRDVWDDLNRYAREKWQLTTGFTELPEQLIFKDKAVLFRYALVFVQEMDKEKIDMAPSLQAGEEVQRIYNSLGIAVNDIARYLREKYGVNCQSNHPLGGLVDTSPLAGKAGMGWQGRNGLLITPEYGQRIRIAPVFIESPIFEYTDSEEHRWIEGYCKSCGLCMKKCPAGAIYEKKKPGIQNVPAIGQTRTCIDRDKCYPQFCKTLGCSVCIKTCPFSRGNGVYEKLKKGFDKKNQNKAG